MATQQQSPGIVTRIRQIGWGVLVVLVIAEAVLVFVATRQDDSSDRQGTAAQADRTETEEPAAAEPEATGVFETPSTPELDPVRETTTVVIEEEEQPQTVVTRRSIFEGGGSGGGRPRTDEEQEAEAEAQRLLEAAVRALQEEAPPPGPAVAPTPTPAAPSAAVPVTDSRLEAAQERMAAADAAMAEFKEDNERIADYVALQSKIKLYEQNTGNERIAQLLKEARAEIKTLGRVSETQITRYREELSDLRREQRSARSTLRALTAGK